MTMILSLLSSPALVSALMVVRAKNIVIEEEKKEDKKSELELTDDLFNLIDSMYKERDE